MQIAPSDRDKLVFSLEGQYGKTKVRCVKLTKHTQYHNDIISLEVECLLEGAFDTAYTEGDNRCVVPTDTIKNSIYLLARQNEFTCIENFGVIVCRHFLERHSHVRRVTTKISQNSWDRLMVDGKPHSHVFTPTEGWRVTTVTGSRIADDKASILTWNITSGLRNFRVLKTTQSGFTDFVVDEYTSLRPSEDRILCTSIDADWEYAVTVSRDSFDFNDAYHRIFELFKSEFAGPSDTGKYSKSVQETMYQMARRVLEDPQLSGSLESVNLTLPNVHHIEFNMEPFGFLNNGTVFYPTDAPSGLIKCCLRKQRDSQPSVSLQAKL